MRRLALPALVLSLLCSNSATATVMLKLELPQLVGRADVIFVGKASKQNSRWSEDGKHIITDTTFQVLRNMRGAAVGRAVVIRSLGGVVDGVGMRVFGSPQFQVGQEVVLFTEQRAGHRYVSGMTQGVFTVTRDAAGLAHVRSTATGVTLTRRSPGGGLEPVQPSAAPEKLDLFVSRVHQTIASCAREKSRCQDR